MLNNPQAEQQIQDFIEDNTFMFAPFASLKDIHPKYQLGKEFITDFVIENKPVTPFSHTFVEIEPASESLFLKTDGRETEFTQRANHAIEQLRDWHIWVRDNISYIRQDFPDLDICNYLLIMGRNAQLSTQQRRKLAELNSEHNWRRVLTYDDLAIGIRQLIENLKKLDEQLS